MKKHQKLSIVVLIITIIAVIGSQIYIRYLDDEIQRNLEELEWIEEYSPGTQT
jgi:hypothetical protein